MNGQNLAKIIKNSTTTTFSADKWAENTRGLDIKPSSIKYNHDGSIERQSYVTLDDGGYLVTEVLVVANVSMEQLYKKGFDCIPKQKTDIRRKNVTNLFGKQCYPREYWENTDWSLSDKQIALESGRSLSYIRKLRMAMTGKDSTVKGISWIKVDWDKSNIEIAEEINRSPKYVQSMRYLFRRPKMANAS